MWADRFFPHTSLGLVWGARVRTCSSEVQRVNITPDIQSNGLRGNSSTLSLQSSIQCREFRKQYINKLYLKKKRTRARLCQLTLSLLSLCSRDALVMMHRMCDIRGTCPSTSLCILDFFFYHGDKHHTQSNLQMRGFVWDYSSREIRTHLEQEEQEAKGSHLEPASWKQRE